MSAEYKSTCGHLERLMDEWPHPFEVSTLTNLENGKTYPQFVIRLHKITDEGRVSNSESGRTWTKIHHCPFCGAPLPDESESAA